jgi:hypothetical protein
VGRILFLWRQARIGANFAEQNQCHVTRGPRIPTPYNESGAHLFFSGDFAGFLAAILPGDNGAMFRFHWLITFVAVATAFACTGSAPKAIKAAYNAAS